MCCPRLPSCLPESSAHLISSKDGSRFEFLVLLLHLQDTLFFVVSSLGLSKPLGEGFICVSSFPLGQTFMLHKCGCAQSLSGDRIKGKPHTADFLLIVAQGLGLSKGDDFQRCWSVLLSGIWSDALSASTTPALAWGPGHQITGWHEVLQDFILLILCFPRSGNCLQLQILSDSPFDVLNNFCCFLSDYN